MGRAIVRTRIKLVASLLVALLAFSALAGCGPAETDPPESDAQTEAEPLRIIVADAKSTHHLNLYVAQEFGLFEAQGLDVEIVDVADLTAARDLVVSGSADVFWSCPTVALAATANGAPVQAIAQVKTPCTSVLLVPQDSPIETLADLDGRAIAGLSPSCEAVIGLTLAAREVGAEFTLDRLKGGDAITALQAGAVDGAILEEPHASIAELEGFKILFDEISKSIPCRTINARNAVIEANAEGYKRFIAAIDEANRIILADPAADNIVAIAVQYTGAPEDAIRNGNYRLEFDTALETEGLLALTDQLVDLDVIDENPGADALFSAAFKGVTW